MDTPNKSTVMLTTVCVLLLLALGYVYYANYVGISPNHPNSPYASLFPGMNIDMAKGPDIGQMMSMSMVFVVKNTNGQFGNNQPYGLATIGRMGCNSYSGYALAETQPIDVSQYEGKAVLVRQFAMSDADTNEMTLQRVDMDQYVNDHMDEYRAVPQCSTAFNAMGLKCTAPQCFTGANARGM